MTNAEIDRIVQTLESGGEQNKYYVYMLCRGNGQPFYVGKGQGPRILEHEEEAQERFFEIDADEELSEEEKDLKRSEVYEKLRIIAEEGDNLKRVIVKWGLKNHEAYMCESALINALGFLGENGMINNLANRVNGHASEAEKDCPSDVKTQARLVESFLNECAIKEVSVDGIKECVVLIKINDFYTKCRNENGKIDVAKVRECARGIWHIGPYMNDRIRYIFALYHGRVVGIFHVTGISRKVKDEMLVGAVDYPTFPQDVRDAEKLALQFDTLEQAKAKLTSEQYRKVDEFLARVAQAKRRTREYVFEDLKERVYFHVDDNVPEDIMTHMNTIAVGDDDSSKFKCQAPIQYNHR